MRKFNGDARVENTKCEKSRSKTLRKVKKVLRAGKSSSRHGMHGVDSDLVHPRELERLGKLKLISPGKPLKFRAYKKDLKREGLKPKAIHFSQESVSGEVNGQHGEKVPFAQFCGNFRENGWMTDPTTGQLINPVDVVYNDRDGLYITLDHRRVVAAKLADIQRMFVRVHEWDDLLPPEYIHRFGDARTWGDAVMYRLDRQQTMRVPSPELPRVNGLTYRERQDLGLLDSSPRSRPSSSLSSSSRPSSSLSSSSDEERLGMMVDPLSRKFKATDIFGPGFSGMR